MKMVKVPVSNELLLQLLHLDSDKYKIHFVATSNTNPTITDLFITGEDLPEVGECGVTDADIHVQTKVKECGHKEYEASIQTRKW
jgi:hypothetical protein